MTTHTADIIADLVRALAPVPPSTLDDDALFVRDLGYDSLHLVELAGAVEDLFEMDPALLSEAPRIESVAALRAFVENALTAGQATQPGQAAVTRFFEDL